MNILGINSVYHESSAALLSNGRIIAAAEEERFNRIKHGKPALVSNPHVLPEASIAYCLERGSIKSKELDAIAFSFSPTMREETFVIDDFSHLGDWGSESGEALFRKNLCAVPQVLERVLGCPLKSETFHWVPHHHAHAAGAFYISGFDGSAILVLDGIGESASGMTGVAYDGKITPLTYFPYPHSLGLMWEKLSRFLGFSEYDACKVMGMAAYGNPSIHRSAFERFFCVDSRGELSCDLEILRYRLDDFCPLERLLGKARSPGQPLEPRHFHIAATLQECTDRAVLRIAERLRLETGISNLCYSGGVALNCMTNWKLLQAGIFTRVFIPNAPHDAGTAIGAGFCACAAQGGLPKADWSAFTGPEFSSAQIEDALNCNNLDFVVCDDIAHRVARLLADGKIVGWFQDRMEFGPRALGNRSLLADPRNTRSRERMNHLVKRREDFRPFAPSVLASHAHEWFNLGPAGAPHELMLITCPTLPGIADKIPAVLHVDGTARLQLVRPENNPRYYSLIEAFHEITRVPMVLNTSFNDSEPIVCTPRDAVQTFQNSQIDALAIGDYLVMPAR